MGLLPPHPFFTQSVIRRRLYRRKNWVDRLDARLDAIGANLAKKEVHIPTDLAGGILFFLFAIVILLVTPQQVTISVKDIINGRMFPRLLMIVMMVCCALLIGKELYKIARKLPITYKTVNLLVEIKALVILAILVLTYAVCRVTNLFAAGSVFCCIGFLLYFRCKKPLYYAVTVILAVAIWAAFRFGLNVNF